MGINPGEDIVNVWLQENNYFTMTNVSVKNPTRLVDGKKRAGNKRSELDILAVNSKGTRIWVEISVSPNPRVDKKKGEDYVVSIVEKFSNKFTPEHKRQKVEEIFGSNSYEKWFVYSDRLFSKSEDELRFKSLLQSKNIRPVNFKIDVLNPIVRELNHYGTDAARIYLYYLKFFRKEAE